MKIKNFFGAMLLFGCLSMFNTGAAVASPSETVLNHVKDFLITCKYDEKHADDLDKKPECSSMNIVEKNRKYIEDLTSTHRGCCRNFATYVANKFEEAGVPNIIVGGETDDSACHCINLFYKSESEEWIAFDPAFYVRLSEECSKVCKGKSLLYRKAALDNREKAYTGSLSSFLNPTKEDMILNFSQKSKSFFKKNALTSLCVLDAPTDECRYFDGRVWDILAYDRVLEHKTGISFLQKEDKTNLLKDTIFNGYRDSHRNSCESPEAKELLGLKCLLFKHGIFSTERCDILSAVNGVPQLFPLIISTINDNNELIRKLNEETGSDICDAVKISPLLMSLKK